MGNEEKLIKVDNKTYNSAGVLIINKKHDIDCIVLFKVSRPINEGVNKGKFFCDITGGGIDIKDKSIEFTAKREVYEETKKLLLISSDNLKLLKENNLFLELTGRRSHGRKAGLFACYVARLPFLSSRVYNINKDILKKIKLDNVFYETIEMVRFPISNFVEYFKGKNLSDIKKQIEIKDIDGITQSITLFATKCVYLALNNKTIMDSPILLNKWELSQNGLEYQNKKGLTVYYN